MFKVRITWEGEVLKETDLDSLILAERLFESTRSDYARQNDDMSEGVSISLIEVETDSVKAEGTFAMGVFFRD